MKGVFGEGASVVAVPPKPPPAAGPASVDAVANLFASDQRVAAPLLSTDVENDNEAQVSKRNATMNRGLWSDPEPDANEPKPRAQSRKLVGLPQAVTGGAAPAAPAPKAVRAPIEAPVAGGTRSVELDAPAAVLELQTGPRISQPRAEASMPHPAQRNPDLSSASIARRAPEPPLSATPAPSAKSSRRGKERKRDKARASAPHVAPSAAARRTQITPAKLMLAGCGVLLACVATLWIGASAGLWTLPPSAAAMLGHESATRASKPTGALSRPPVVDPVAIKPPTAAAAPDTQPEAPTPAPAAEVAAKTEPAKEPPATAHSAPAAEPAEAPAEVVADAPPEAAATPAAAAPANDKITAAPARTKAANDSVGAEARLRAALAQDPTDHHVMEVLVQVLIDKGRGPEALKYAAEIVHKRPKRASYRVLQGDAMQLVGDAVGAGRAWREALALEPTNREAKRRLAALP